MVSAYLVKNSVRYIEKYSAMTEFSSHVIFYKYATAQTILSLLEYSLTSCNRESVC